ncbi:tetratricopeptide repeat protein [Nonomuraea glycinis]|nr:tetratricopeptide repeat protein [Nonomuraea glycinis]MCA2178467.1 tetratricopeptide repeat protein [Nonomuraea glycinis]
MDATASDQGRVYQAGRDQTVNQTTVLPGEALRPVTEVAAPPRLVNAPRHTGVFVGRGDELTELEAALRGGGEVVVAAVHGLGGVGKSTLAARYARAHAARGDGTGLNPVWWITADSSAAVEAGLAALTVALQPELTTALPLEALAERATAWLAAHDGWLLVLDNVVDPADVAPLLERTMAGQVLVTSRLSEGWHRLGAQRVLRLDVLGEREAIELLISIATHALPAFLDHSGNVPDTLDGAVELVRELGWLPLAIEQVGAYLHQNRLSPRTYLSLLAEHPAVMYDHAARGSDSERTIARIWRLTLDQLTEVSLAGLVLRLLAWYGAESIPRILLDGLAVCAPDLQQALGSLAAYNMISLDGTGITVHRLVQAVARTADAADPHRQSGDINTGREQATTLLDRTLPDWPVHPDDWSTWRTFLPHITALADHTPPAADTQDTAHLLKEAGLFLGNQGAVVTAIDWLQRATSAYQRVLGDRHPDTLTSRNDLAGVYREAWDLGRAIPLYEATLADRERVLGDSHPDTLISRNDLASAYEAAGDLDLAIPLYERTLANRERVLSIDHPAILTSRNNLAGAYQAAGDLGKAISLFEVTLAECVRILGGDDRDALATCGNLAGAYWKAGDLGRAISLFETALAGQERVLGDSHPDTLRSRINLASVYQEAGDLGRAISLFESALADCERVLNDEHPITLTSRNNLAGAYETAGDLGRAILLYERTLADCERVLGADHPTTRTVQANLAAALR